MTVSTIPSTTSSLYWQPSYPSLSLPVVRAADSSALAATAVSLADDAGVISFLSGSPVPVDSTTQLYDSLANASIATAAETDGTTSDGTATSDGTSASEGTSATTSTGSSASNPTSDATSESTSAATQAWASYLAAGIDGSTAPSSLIDTYA